MDVVANPPTLARGSVSHAVGQGEPPDLGRRSTRHRAGPWWRGQNAHTWDSVALALACRLVAIDLPGHGHSGWRPDRNCPPIPNPQTLAHVMDEMELQAVTFVGMSLGGLTGIALASKRPDLVRRLMLIDVTPGVRNMDDNLSASQRGATTLVGVVGCSLPGRRWWTPQSQPRPREAVKA